MGFGRERRRSDSLSGHSSYDTCANAREQQAYSKHCPGSLANSADKELVHARNISIAVCYRELRSSDDQDSRVYEDSYSEERNTELGDRVRHARFDSGESRPVEHYSELGLRGTSLVIFVICAVKLTHAGLDEPRSKIDGVRLQSPADNGTGLVKSIRSVLY